MKKRLGVGRSSLCSEKTSAQGDSVQGKGRDRSGIVPVGEEEKVFRLRSCRSESEGEAEGG